MTYSDDFLVQKLRDILLRLYPTPQTSPFIISENGSNSKFPKLYFSNPDEDRFGENENIAKTEFAIGPQSGGGERIGREFETGRLGENETLFSDVVQKQDANLFAVVHNISNFDHLGVDESSIILGNVTTNPEQRDDLYDTTLTRHLHEFIQVLKMSLSSGGTFHSAGGEIDVNARVGGVDSGHHLDHISTRISTSGAGLSPNDLEFNLTLDDILDLNMLLDGSESAIQFKHVLIIVLYFLIAVISIVGNLLVVQVIN